MKRFSKKSPFDKAICPTCGLWKPTDFSPEELRERDWECADCTNKKFNELQNKEDIEKEVPSEVTPPNERGSKVISKYDPEYEFLIKLVQVIGKASPEALRDIKQITLQNPFVTVDDVGNLAAKIWTLATTKYNIPREWLLKKLPEKKNSLKKADLKEYSNAITKAINDIIVSDPRIMEKIIEASENSSDSNHLEMWMRRLLEDIARNVFTDYRFENQPIYWSELAYAWFHTIKRGEPLPSEKTIDIQNLPTLNKKQKLDDLLDQLSIETDPHKKEQIKQHIERIKRAKLLKADLWPSQAASENTLSHPHNSLSYNPLQEPDLSVSGPNPNDAKDDALWDIVVNEFFTAHKRWSDVVKAIKLAHPEISDEDILSLKDKVKKSLDKQMGIISSKKQAYHAINDLIQFTLDDKEIQQHFKNRGTTVEDVIASLPNFTIKYFTKDLERQDPSLKDTTKGFYDYNSGTLHINPRLSLDGKRITIIHEIEHALQDFIGELPVHTPEDLQKTKQIPYEERTFELGAKQQQFNALRQRGMGLEEIINYYMKRYNYPEDSRELLRDELEQFDNIYEEMMPESIMASKTAKKKGLSLEDVLKILETKNPKPTHVDYTDCTIEFSDGSKITFDEATKRVIGKKADKEVHCPNCKRLREYEDVVQDGKCDQCNKEGVFSGAEFSTTEFNVNPTLDLGPYSSPQDAGAHEQKSPFPNADWLPADDENTDEEPYSDISASKHDNGSVPRSEARFRVLLFDRRGVQYFPNEESAKKYYEVALKEDKDPSKPEPYIYKKAHCGPCAVIKAEVIKMLSDLKYKDESVKAEDLEKLAKLSADPSNNSFIKYLGKVIESLPKEHDKEITKLTNHKLALEDIQKRIDDGDMLVDKPISKKDALLKQANPPSRFWIAPDGREFGFDMIHPVWIRSNEGKKILKSYGLDNRTQIHELMQQMFKQGWTRISNEPYGKGFQIEVYDIDNVPSYLDNFVAKYFKMGEEITIGSTSLEQGVGITDPFPSLQKAINKEFRRSKAASLKQAGNVITIGNTRVYKNPTFQQAQNILNKSKDKIIRAIIDPETQDLYIWDAFFAEHSQIGWNLGLSIDFDNPNDVENYLWVIGTESGELENLFQLVNEYKSKSVQKQADFSGKAVNDILNGIQANGGITYNLQSGNLNGTNNYAVSIYPQRSKIIPSIVDFDIIEDYLVNNQDLLQDPNNSFGVWTNGSKIYLDVVVTIPDREKAIELAKANNQIAIWDLRNNKEILTGGTGEVVNSFSKKELVKNAEEQLLTQEDQNEIAARWCPAMNILLNNYAEARKSGHEKDRSFEYAYESIQNIDKSITEKDAIEAINTYLNGLIK